MCLDSSSRPLRALIRLSSTNTMFVPTVAALSLLVASAAASGTPVLEARTANPTIYMRIEGPTKTIYEKTIVASPLPSILNNGHTAVCKY